MSVTSDRSVVIQSTLDVEYQQAFAAQTNEDASGINTLVELVAGNNTIIVPDDAIAVTIIKPDDNEVVLILKGGLTDTGITLNPVDPDSISLDGVSLFYINASFTVTVRLIFT